MLVTRTFQPVAPLVRIPAGNTAVICVSLSTVQLVAAVPAAAPAPFRSSSFTAPGHVRLAKFVPVMRTVALPVLYGVAPLSGLVDWTCTSVTMGFGANVTVTV